MTPSSRLQAQLQFGVDSHVSSISASLNDRVLVTTSNTDDEAEMSILAVSVDFLRMLATHMRVQQWLVTTVGIYLAYVKT